MIKLNLTVFWETNDPTGKNTKLALPKRVKGEPKWIDWVLETHHWMDWEATEIQPTSFSSPFYSVWLVPKSDDFEEIDPDEISSGAFLEFAEISQPSVKALDFSTLNLDDENFLEEFDVLQSLEADSEVR